MSHLRRSGWRGGDARRRAWRSGAMCVESVRCARIERGPRVRARHVSHLRRSGSWCDRSQAFRPGLSCVAPTALVWSGGETVRGGRGAMYVMLAATTTKNRSLRDDSALGWALVLMLVLVLARTRERGAGRR